MLNQLNKFIIILPHWIAQVTDTVGCDAEAPESIIFHVHVSTMNCWTSCICQTWLKLEGEGKNHFNIKWEFQDVRSIIFSTDRPTKPLQAMRSQGFFFYSTKKPLPRIVASISSPFVHPLEAFFSPEASKNFRSLILKQLTCPTALLLHTKSFH